MLPPPAYELEEERFIFRAPPAAGGIDRRTGRPVQGVRPNLIVHRQAVPPDATLDELAHQRLAELLSSLGDLQEVETGTLLFADGTPGRLIALTLPAMGVVRLRQWHGLRLDGRVLTAGTITADAARLTDEAIQEHLQTLARLGRRED